MRVAFVWAFVQLRSGAHRRLEDELAAAVVDDDRSRRAARGDTGRRTAGAAATAAMPVAPSRPGPRPRPPAGRRPRTRRRPPPVPAAPPVAGHRRDRRAADLDPARPASSELGVIGWFRARLDDAPIRPDRSAAARAARAAAGSTGSTCGSLVVLVVATLVLRTFRLAEPYQMHFDEVYHARTATEFLQDWRYGLVARHLRVDPPAPRQVRDGRRARPVGRGRGQRHERARACPVAAAVVEPRRDRRARARRPGRRAAPRRDRHRDPDLRPAHPRSSIATIAAPGATRAGDRRRPAASWSSATRTDGSATLDLDLDRRRRRRRRRSSRSRVATRRPSRSTHLLVRRRRRERRRGLGRSADRRSTSPTGDVDRLASTCPGIADLAPGGTGSALVADVDEVDDPAAVAVDASPTLLGGDAADYRGAARRRVAGDDGRPRRAPATGDARNALEAAIADGDAARHRRSGPVEPRRGRDDRRRHLRRPGDAARSSRRSRSRAAPTAWRS